MQNPAASIWWEFLAYVRNDSLWFYLSIWLLLSIIIVKLNFQDMYILTLNFDVLVTR